MRFTLLFIVWLSASGLVAAPVPADRKAEEQRLEKLWDEVWANDAVVRARAVFALIDHPKAAEFLGRKLPPVKAPADQLTAWLKDLNSDDEKVWKAALAELWYHDPRTELTAAEQVALVSTDNGRRLLASVWWGWLKELEPQTVRTTLVPQPGNRWYTLHEHRADGGSSGTGFDVAPVAEIATPTWQRAAVAAVILHRIDTATSRAVLEKLATGHKDALPTRTATELFKAKPAAGMTEKRFDPIWHDLLQNVPNSSEPVAITRGLLALVNAPDSAALLKTKLPAIKADKERVTKWLKSLDSADSRDWKPAFEMMRYNLPLLALDWQQQCDAVKTEHGRSALYLLWCNNHIPDKIEVYPDAQLSPREDGLKLTASNQQGNGVWSMEVVPGTLATASSPHWQRARLAILALERMKSAEAKAVLKQLADGHPDILPTKEAKAALKRLDGK